MSSFSFTAPCITPEEERIERQGLTQAELEEIDRDLFGTDCDVGEDASLVADCIAAMHQVIEGMDDDEKDAYLTALEISPLLVETESNPIKFLRCEQFEPMKAAKRLMAYWKVRRSVFGYEKAFLPMTLNGAMNGMEESLRKGTHILLPYDSKGRPVIYWDRIRSMRPICERNEAYQVSFFVRHIMSESIVAQKRGHVLIVNVRSFDLYKHYDRMLIKQHKTLADAIPSKVKATHCFGGSETSVYSQVVAPADNFVIGRYLRLRQIVHQGTDQEVIQKLGPYGLGRPHIIVERGGTITQSYIDEWIEQQVAE